MKSKLRSAHHTLARVVLDRYPDEAARVLESAAVTDVALFLATESAARAAELLKRLTPDQAAQVIAEMDTASAARVLSALDLHRAAVLVARLDRDVARSRLAAMDPALAQDLRATLEYPPDTAGSLMDPRVTVFRPDASVRDVVRRLRVLRRERIQDIFLADAEGILVGSVPLQDVVLASGAEPLEALARSTPPFVEAVSSREEVMDALQRHRVGSLPVVDYDGRLLGVLRQQELIAAAQEEATADLLTMVGANKNERALSPALFAVRKRLPWLQVNLLTAFLAAAVVGIFENTIARFTALAVLLPVVAGQSGNTGAQALAVTMRGLALREIRVRHWLRVASKELAVATMNGVAVAITTSIAVYVWSRSIGLALVIGISMVLSMMTAGLAGATVPMVLTALRQDPAQSSSIVLTTITDVAGFLSFLGIATLLSSLL